MPLFICDKCHAIENTALGNYWTRGKYGRPKEALCSECMPAKFNPPGRAKFGKWHGFFAKEIATPELIKKYGEDMFVYVSDIPGVQAKRR